MLFGQARIAARSTDIFNMKTFACYAGQGQRRSEYLASSFARAAIDNNSFNRTILKVRNLFFQSKSVLLLTVIAYCDHIEGLKVVR